jgi:hypothetical protein
MRSDPAAPGSCANGAAGKRAKRVRSARALEPTRLTHFGVLAGWDSRWKVGYILGDDRTERPVDIRAFGAAGLECARVGLRVEFSLRLDGSVLGVAPAESQA